MKRIVAAVTMLALALGLLAGCGVGTKTQAPVVPTKEVTITYARGKDSSPATAKTLEAFQKKYPTIKVNYVEMPNSTDTQHDQYATKLAAGDTSIDVFAMDIIWPSEFGAAKWVLPLDPYFTKEELSAFLPGPVEGNRYQGKLYSIPMFTSGGALYYRKDILDKYGKKPPKTWDEMVALSKELVGKDGIEFGLMIQGAQYEGLVCNIQEYMLGNGGKILDGDKVVINSANNLEALKFLKSLIDQKIVAPGALTHKETEARKAFLEGKALFMRHWAPAYSGIQNDPASKVKGKVGVVPVPMGPKGKQPSSTLGGWNLGINANLPKERLDAAVLFVKWMVSEEAGKILAMEGSNIPIRKALFEDPEILKAYPHWKEFYPIFLTADPRPVSPRYPKISDVIQVNVHKVLSGTMTPEDALKAMQTGIEKVVSAK